MEESHKNDLKNITLLNLVPKVEPDDGEYVLYGEFVENVSPASTALPLRTEDYKDLLSEGITGGKPFNLNPKAEPRTSWIYTKNKAQLTEELRKLGLPTKGKIKEQRRQLCNFIRRNYRPSEDKTTDPGASVTFAATPEGLKSTKSEPRTSYVYTKSKAQLMEEQRKLGLPTKGNIQEQHSSAIALLCSFVRRFQRSTESNTTDPGVFTTSVATPEDSTLGDDSDSDEVRSKPVQCSALQDGILCQCCNCTKVLEGTKSLNTAIALEKPFRCEPCNLQFHFKSRLKKHLRTHGGIKPFPCDICGSAYTMKISLKKHKLLKHSSNLKPQQDKETCSICDKVLSSKPALKIHFANVHMNVNNKCKHCGFESANKLSCLRHIRRAHAVGEELICDHCSKTFYDKTKLINHIQSLHLPNEIHKCQKCDHALKTKTGLYSHYINVHSDRRFSCEVCGKMFSTKAHLQIHMVVHSEEKQFICQTCGKRFKRDCNLQQHQYTHSDGRPHICNICGLKFRLKTHVKQHMAVHGVIKNQKCPICGKGFARKAELKCHFLTHGI